MGLFVPVEMIKKKKEMAVRKTKGLVLTMEKVNGDVCCLFSSCLVILSSFCLQVEPMILDCLSSLRCQLWMDVE